MKDVGVLEAKTHLSALIAEVERSGEPIGITRHGRRIARIVPDGEGGSALRRRFTGEEWAARVKEMRRQQDELVAAFPQLAEPYDLRTDRDEIC